MWLDRFRRMRRRIGSQAELSIRPLRPWWWRWSATLGTALLSVALLFGLLRGMGADWLSPLRLRDENRNLEQQLAQQAAALHAAQEQLSLQERARSEDRAARDSLAQDLAALREENLHLKEDLASLRSLKSSDNAIGNLRVSGFRVGSGQMPGEYRWHLLVAQGGRQVQDFHGNLRLRVELAAGSAPAAAPGSDGARDRTQALSFKYYQELEGGFRIAPDQKLVKVWADVWRDGQSQPVASLSYPLP